MATIAFLGLGFEGDGADRIDDHLEERDVDRTEHEWQAEQQALLFERTPRAMLATEIGSHVVDYARRALTDGERFAGALANLANCRAV